MGNFKIIYILFKKELKIKNKADILKIGIDKFVKACREFALKNLKLMNKDFKRLGVWMDFDDSYMPIKNEFMENEWLLIKKAYEQKRLYLGEKTMTWCQSCETALAKHELEYENITDVSIYMKFKKKNSKNEYFVIFTTTPWTIPYNLAIMVNPGSEYVKMKVDNEIYIIAEDLAETFADKIP